MEQDSRLRQWLMAHPRLMGALFAALVLLTQVSGTVAASCTTTSGP